jgi:hypothetical protein
MRVFGRSQSASSISSQFLRCACSRANEMSLSQIAVALAHALAGWVLCGATMGIGLANTSLDRALVIHAVAAPIIFALISTIYFVYFGYSGALATAASFVAIVIAMDVFVVALLIQREFTMFRSVLGTWLPFALIFAATYVTGLLTGR